VAILEYSDFDCTFCARYATEIFPLIDQAYIQAGSVKYFFRDLPNPDHLNALFKEEEAFETKVLGTDTFSGKVGAFEGANYEGTGYYRAQTDCIMFTRDAVPFCAACQAAIERVIRLYAGSGRH